MRHALTEDIGSGDVTAQLIPEHRQATAHLRLREPAVLCGQAWANAVFAAVDPNLSVHWLCAEGDWLEADCTVLELHGNARSILTAERSAINFLQTLSGTATTTRRWASHLASTSTQLLDTRKTIPGLRTAQKYAVAVGGGKNHRQGLFDAFLIKENHIIAAGSLRAAITAAQEPESDLLRIAQTGVDFISVGALTKNLQSIDFSLRFSLR
ncbi:MAG: nicotinate-nucleotide diphosphorylase [Gammaproteobacteria bacterium]